MHSNGKYGSPKVDEADDAAMVRSISDDGRTIFVDLPLQVGQVYQIITQGVRADDGASMSTTTGYYTLNSLLK
jgi:hypothetical protein